MNKTLVSILGGLGGMFGWGTSDFFASLYSDKIGHLKTFFWSQVVGMFFTLFLIPFFGLNTGISYKFTILLIIASVFYAAAYLFFYKGFEVGDVSVVSATINLYAVFTMIFAFIFLNQRLTTLQIIAVLIIIAGVFLVSLNFNELHKRKLKLLSGVRETLIASLLFGVFWNMSEVISEGIGWMATTLFIKIGAILFLIVFSMFIKQRLGVSKMVLKVKLFVLAVGVFEAAAVACVNYGIIVGDVILVTPISSALSVVTIMMAVIFLKEKISNIQKMGILTVIVGIVLTAF